MRKQLTEFFSPYLHMYSNCYVSSWQIKQFHYKTNEASSSSQASGSPAFPHVHQLHALTVGPGPGHPHLVLQDKTHPVKHDTLPVPHTPVWL